MSIKCGNRKTHGNTDARHETAAEVRACYQAGNGAAASASVPTFRRVTNLDAHREATLLRQPGEVVVGGTLHEGTFTVQFEDGEYRTLRIRRQADDTTFKPGVLLVSYLDGPDNTYDYTSFGHVREYNGRAVSVRIWQKHKDNEALLEAVRVLCEDPQAAATAYAEQSGNCSRCGRELTVPSSLHAGLGPVCAQKVAA